MSGFGGFGTGTTGRGLFGDKPPEQNAGGFTVPTTTVATTATSLTFGTPAFGAGNTNMFGTQQQTPTFGAGFGSKQATTATGFSFNPTTTNTAVPTFGIASTNVTAPTFGITPNTTATGLNTSVTNTTLPTFGSSPLALNTPKTTGFNAPITSTVAPASFTFGTTTTTTTTTTTSVTSTTLTFGVPKTAITATGISTAPSVSFGISTTGVPTAPLVSFGISTAGATASQPTTGATTSQPATGFSLSQATTTASLNFGLPKTTKALTFETPTTGFNASSTTTATTFNTGTATTAAPTFGANLFGTPKTTELGSGTTTTSAGLGGIDNKQTTQGLSGTGSLEPKQAKDHNLPDPILQTLNEFQNFTKQQKSLSVEISHGSSKPLKKVQEDTEAMESLLTMITSGLTRNAIAVDKLKTETAQGLHQAELAQRNHETPPGLDYDNSAPADYFNDLVTKFETDAVRLRVQIEASEKHLRSLTQSSIISPQELTLAMRRLHETLIVLAARVQALHTSVQSQKEQFKNIRRVYFKDDTNIFENDSDQNLVKKQTIYSLRSLTGPTPFSENTGTGPALNVDGLAMLASSTVASIPVTSANARTTS